jgi:hypothetical protein
MCAFETVSPAWYASRTVHIHVAAPLPTGRRAVTQLYFPDELTDEVFTRPPYAGRPPRDTTNATDSIFADGGSRTLMQLTGDAVEGLTGVLCVGIEPHPAPTRTATPAAVFDRKMASAQQLRAVVEAQVDASRRCTRAGRALCPGRPGV